MSAFDPKRTLAAGPILADLSIHSLPMRKNEAVGALLFDGLLWGVAYQRAHCVGALSVTRWPIWSTPLSGSVRRRRDDVVHEERTIGCVYAFERREDSYSAEA